MRTTHDLIIELDHNAEGYQLAALIVGFDHDTIFITSKDEDRLRRLNEAVKQGGEPVGWYCWNPGHLEMGLLTEHEHED